MSDVGTAAAGGGVGLGVTQGLPTITSTPISTIEADKKSQKVPSMTTESLKAEVINEEADSEVKEKEVPGALPVAKVRESKQFF